MNDSSKEPSPPDDVRNPLITAFEWTSTLLAILASLLILFVTLLVSYNALSRWWLGESVPGTIELVEYGLVWITFLGAAWILRRDGHVKVDVLYMVLPDSVVRYLWYGAMVVAAVATVFMAYYSGMEVYSDYDRGRRLIRQLVFQRWWISIIIPIGFSMLTVEFLVLLLKGPESQNVLDQEKLIDL
jgi:TRAP-type C4-dicarboxylate transport system permease small subunit